MTVDEAERALISNEFNAKTLKIKSEPIKVIDNKVKELAKYFSKNNAFNKWSWNRCSSEIDHLDGILFIDKIKGKITDRFELKKKIYDVSNEMFLDSKEPEDNEIDR